MACSSPMWRLSWSEVLNNSWCRHRLADLYERRVHNDGVILQQPEAEMIKREYPALAANMQQIPCGKCTSCRLSYSRDWANRCMCEFKTSDNAYFLTLTYDDAHLQFAPYVDPDTGECSTRPVLVPSDLQKFLKRVRKYCSDIGYRGQRFFACGEYGDEYLRPHYHMILYNVPLQLLEGAHLWPDSKPGAPLWTAPELSNLWPHGIVVYGDVTWSTCAYVARYVMKKRKGKDHKAQIDAQNVLFPSQPWQDEFVRMSRRPGIGKMYYIMKKDDIYATDEIFLPIKELIQAVKPSKYYDKLYDVNHHQELRRIKKARSDLAEKALATTLQETDLTEVEYLEMKDRSKEDQSRRLVRPLI